MDVLLDKVADSPLLHTPRRVTRQNNSKGISSSCIVQAE